MKYCTHCGNEMNDEAVVCIKCGCAVNGAKVTKSSYADSNKKTSVSLILGIIGIVSAWLFALIGHITSVIGIILGIKEYNETKNMTGLTLSIIGEVCSIFSSIIGAVAFSGIF